MKRSKRFEKLEQMPINKDGFSYEWEEVGLITMESRFDPKPSIKVENGVIVEMDGIKREDFDSLDKFIADYGIKVEMLKRLWLWILWKSPECWLISMFQEKKSQKSVCHVQLLSWQKS